MLTLDKPACSTRPLVTGLRVLVVSVLVTVLLTGHEITFQSARPPGLARFGLFWFFREHRYLGLLIFSGLLAGVMTTRLPRISFPLGWFAMWSFQTATPAPEGGDQIASQVLLVAALFLVFMARGLTQSLSQTTIRTSWNQLYRGLEILLCAIYLNSAIAKLSRVTWQDGTAMYYIHQDGQFGAAWFLRPFSKVLFNNPLPTAFATWGAILFELVLAVGAASRPLLDSKALKILLAIAVSLHGAIALLLGLPTFGLVMIGFNIIVFADRTKQSDQAENHIVVDENLRANFSRSRGWLIRKP